MQRGYAPRYATVPIGAAGDVTNPKPGSIEWDMQTGSFLLSMGFQLATLIISAITLANSGEPNPAPPLLIIVVTMELIVQCVEILWYGIVGALYYFGQLSIGVQYRYYDWAITTPVGLVGLIIFVWYLECQAATVDKLSETSRIITMIVIVLFDLEMLAIGYVYEAEWKGITNFFDDILSKMTFGWVSSGLVLGWIPFLGIFIPMFVALGTAQPVASADGTYVFGYGVFAVSITFVTWALYGVVALYFRTADQAKMKNTAYNLLDIVSNLPPPTHLHVHLLTRCVARCSGEQEHSRASHEHRRTQPLYSHPSHPVECHRVQRHGFISHPSWLVNSEIAWH